MCVCIGGGVAQCSDLNERCSPEKRVSEWGRSKGFMFFTQQPHRPRCLNQPVTQRSPMAFTTEIIVQGLKLTSPLHIVPTLVKEMKT